MSANTTEIYFCDNKTGKFIKMKCLTCNSKIKLFRFNETFPRTLINIRRDLDTYLTTKITAEAL